MTWGKLIERSASTTGRYFNIIMEIKNLIFNPSIETIRIQVLFAFRLYFSIECVRVVLTCLLLWQSESKDEFPMMGVSVIIIGLEAITAQHLFKQRKYSSLIVLFVLMMLNIAVLCYNGQYAATHFSHGAHHSFAFIHTVIGFGVIGFVLCKLRAIKSWIKEDVKSEPSSVAYFQSNGSPYPGGPSNTTFSTATNCNQPNNNSSYPSELACPAYSTVAGTPYESKDTPYPGESMNPAYPTAVANPAVYPSLDTEVPIQNTDPPTHPSS